MNVCVIDVWTMVVIYPSSIFFIIIVSFIVECSHHHHFIHTQKSQSFFLILIINIYKCSLYTLCLVNWLACWPTLRCWFHVFFSFSLVSARWYVQLCCVLLLNFFTLYRYHSLRLAYLVSFFIHSVLCFVTFNTTKNKRHPKRSKTITAKNEEKKKINTNVRNSYHTILSRFLFFFVPSLLVFRNFRLILFIFQLDLLTWTRVLLLAVVE